MKAREAAYQAVLASIREDYFIQDFLQRWKEKEQPSSQDFHLAQEIACGTARMALSLDHLALQLTSSGKLKLKPAERVLLRSAIYQYYYMDRVPIYAIVDETVQIAQREGRHNFARFLNASLRKMPELALTLPQEDLSIRYSYPPFFVEQLIQDYDLSQALAIMETLNHPAPTTVRIRKLTQQLPEGMRLICTEPYPVAAIENSALLPSISSSPDYYIQNLTPATLIGKLCQQLEKAPQRVLDLCASPGGKLIAVHDYFPEAELFANDVSEEKLISIKQNLDKYQIHAHLSCSLGQLLNLEQKFDVIILDVPCSNTGVLHKRPEARWRLSEESCMQLETIQLELLNHALKLLKPSGQLWYLTCSILKRENERLIEKFCSRSHFKPGFQKTVLPNRDGWDGGFGISLH